MTVLRILFAAAFVYAMCSAAGRLLFRAVGLKLRGAERNFLAFTAGASLVSTAVFALAACHLIYTWVLGGVGACILAGWWVLGRDGRQKAHEEDPLPVLWRVLFWGPYLVYACLYLPAALMPETSPDGTVYHLGLVARYYEHRGFYALTTEMYAGLSGGIEMLFLVAFAMGRHSAAAMVHLLFLLSLPFGTVAFARRIDAPRAGVIGALLFYLTPVVGRDGTYAYIDVATACIVFSGFYFLEIWRQDNNRAAIVPAGLLAGFAYACKFTAGIFAVYGLLRVLTLRGDRLKRGLVFCSLVCVTAGPWIVKNAIQFRNPFYPLFNDVFPNPYQYPLIEAVWRHMYAHMNGVTLSAIPYQLAIGGRLDGILGPVFLLCPLALLSLWAPAGRRLMLAFVPLFLPYFANIGARFMILPLPFLCLGLAIGILSIPRVGTGLAVAAVLAHSVSSWPAFIDRWFPGYQWRIDLPQPQFALRLTPEKQYLEQHWRDYEPGLLLDLNVPPGERVLSPAMGQMAYHHREILGTFDSAAGRRAWNTLTTPIVFERAQTWTRRFSFSPLTTNTIRVVADTSDDRDMSVSELRFFRKDTELPRSSSWRLEAGSNPWEVQRAFDGSNVTWWTSGRQVEPGTWIGVTFGAPVLLDTVVVDQIVDQRWTGLHLEATINGEWRTLRTREEGTEHQPRPDLRMALSDELKRQGIRWILIPDSDPAARDLRDNAPYWGITDVAEASGYRLWRID